MKIRVVGDVLSRFRVNRNMSIEKLASKSGMPLETLKNYESGTNDIELQEVESIAKSLKLSWLAFLDDNLEPKRHWGNDNRTLLHQKELLDADVQKVMEDVVFLLDIANELNPGEGFLLPNFKPEIDNPEHTATKLRTYLGISRLSLEKLDNDYAVWKYWKDVFSQKGLYVFERSWSIETIRAFSIIKDKKAAAVVSTKDVPLGRVFSLMHEIFHVINRQDSICDMHFSGKSSDIEVSCNRFAAAFLMPEVEFHNYAKNIGLKKDLIGVVNEIQVKKLQAYFKVSRLSTYRRLNTLGYISNSKYEQIQDEYQGFEKSDKVSTGGSADIYYRTRLNSIGTRFASEIITAHAQGKISTITIANLFGVRVSQLGSINNLMGGTGSGG